MLKEPRGGHDLTIGPRKPKPVGTADFAQRHLCVQLSPTQDDKQRRAASSRSATRFVFVASRTDKDGGSAQQEPTTCYLTSSAPLPIAMSPVGDAYKPPAGNAGIAQLALCTDLEKAIRQKV